MSRSSWNASRGKGTDAPKGAGATRLAGARSVACPRCGAVPGAPCQLTSGTARPDHIERVGVARGQRPPPVDPPPDGVTAAQPLRVLVENQDGNVLRSVPAAYDQAERVKGRLILLMHEAGRRDEVVVRIVDAHGVTW